MQKNVKTLDAEVQNNWRK